VAGCRWNDRPDSPEYAVTVATLTHTHREVGCRVSLEADSKNTPWRRCGARLEQIRGSLREQLRLTRTWAGDDGTIVCRADDPKRIRFELVDAHWLPVIRANPSREYRHG